MRRTRSLDRLPPDRCGTWHCSDLRTRAAVAAALILCCAPPAAGDGFDPQFQSVGVRVRVGGERVLGREQPEAFREWDLWGTIPLPWERYRGSGWGVGTRLLASVGVLKGAESTALVASAIPVLALGSRDGRVNVDFGAGGALLSQHRFAQQDFGGYLQFALTFGVGVPLYRRLGVGYRFVHYSDAGAYGSDTIGADFHMVELSYQF